MGGGHEGEEIGSSSFRCVDIGGRLENLALGGDIEGVEGLGGAPELAANRWGAVCERSEGPLFGLCIRDEVTLMPINGAAVSFPETEGVVDL